MGRCERVFSLFSLAVAAAETRAIWAAGNEYLTKAEPWVKYKSDVDAAAVGVRTGLNLAALFGIIAQPIIPEAAAMILDALGILLYDAALDS